MFFKVKGNKAVGNWTFDSVADLCNLIWVCVCGEGGDFTLRSVGFPLIAQKW